MTRLYVFDADGTLRRTRVPGQPCPRSPEEWELLPDVVARLAAIPFEDGIELGIASNQDQVAYGHLSAAMARALLAELADQASRGPGAPAVDRAVHRRARGRVRVPQAGARDAVADPRALGCRPGRRAVRRRRGERPRGGEPRRRALRLGAGLLRPALNVRSAVSRAARAGAIW
jgi:hypothetical protein